MKSHSSTQLTESNNFYNATTTATTNNNDNIKRIPELNMAKDNNNMTISTTQTKQTPKLSTSFDSIIKPITYRPIKETNKITLSYDPTNKLQILNQFEIIREIGVGMHSKVKLGFDLIQKKPIAIKIMNRREKKRSKFKFEQNFKIRQEINCLKRCNRHNNIIKLYEVLDDFQSRKIYLIMEFCPKGEIKWCPDNVNELDAIGPPDLSFQRSREMIRDVILGLEYLHNQGIIHRDIKPANLLISNNGTIKISDFSISVIMDNDNHPASTENDGNEDFLKVIKTEGTPAFFAPEICLGEEIWEKFNISKEEHYITDNQTQNNNYFISPKIDVWALGITAFCLLFGMLPFTSKFELKLFDKIINSEIMFPEFVELIRNNTSHISSIQEYELAKDFIHKLLKKNPLERMSVDECKNHGFICFDFNTTLPNDSRTKDVKLQQKLKFLTKQRHDTIVMQDPTIIEENKASTNENNASIPELDNELYSDVSEFNKQHNMNAFLSPVPSGTLSNATSSNDAMSSTSLQEPNIDTIMKLDSSSSEMVNKQSSSHKSRSHKNKSRRRRRRRKRRDSGKMVNLPINSSFASLDSFYIENFAMTKLNQEDPTIYNSKFKSLSQPVVNDQNISSRSSQTELKVPRRRRGARRNNQSEPKNKTLYSDSDSGNSNSSLRINVNDINSQPSSRVPSGKLLSPKLHQNFSSFSSNATLSSNGSASSNASIHKDLFRGRVSPHSPLHNDSLPILSSIDKKLENNTPSLKFSYPTDKNGLNQGNNNKIKQRAINSNSHYSPTSRLNTKSPVDSINSEQSSNGSGYAPSSSPAQPSYHVTSEDASIVSFRNMPHLSNMIPADSISSSMSSLTSTSSRSSSSSSASSLVSSSSSSSSSSSASDSETDSGEELILSIGNSGHMRRQLSQHTQKSQKSQKSQAVSLNSPLPNKTLSPATLKRNSFSCQQYNRVSPKGSSTNLLKMSKVDEDTVIAGNFISGEVDSRALLKDLLGKTNCNNTKKTDNHNIESQENVRTFHFQKSSKGHSK